MLLKLLTFAFLPPWILSCNSEESRQEKVDKLRAIGVSSTPLTASPGSVVTLIYYLAGPSGLTLNAQIFSDSNSSVGLQSPATIDQSSTKETNFGNLSLYQITGTVTIPQQARILLSNYFPVRSRYGVRVTSQTGEDQKIVGDILVYPEGSKELQYVTPSVSIQNPAAQTLPSGATQPVELVYNPVNNENFRVGWFVSGGEIKNRRAKSTEWTVPSDKGSHTLIATIRGLKSSAFSLKVMQVNVQ